MPKMHGGSHVPPKKGTFARVLKMLRGYYPVLVPVSALCILFSAVVAAAPDVFIQKVIAVIEKWYVSRDWASALHELLPLIAILITLYVVSMLAVALYTQLMAYITQGFLSKLRITMFEKMQNRLILKLYLDSRPVSNELEEYITNMSELTDKLSIEVADRSSSEDFAPCVKVCRENGEETGLAFHGVPGGHEFTSFVIGLYNASGEGQSVEKDVLEEIYQIDKQTNIMVLVSLSCSMCPDLVIAAQKIASINKMVTAEIYDITHYPKLREKYNVMSVPCLVIYDDKVSFGKKNIKQLLEFIKE